MAAVVIDIANAVDLLVAATQAAAQISTLVQTAAAQGRTTLTAEEWSKITGDETSAENALSQAIAAAKAVK